MISASPSMPLLSVAEVKVTPPAIPPPKSMSACALIRYSSPQVGAVRDADVVEAVAAEGQALVPVDVVVADVRARLEEHVTLVLHRGGVANDLVTAEAEGHAAQVLHGVRVEERVALEVVLDVGAEAVGATARHDACVVDAEVGKSRSLTWLYQMSA